MNLFGWLKRRADLTDPAEMAEARQTVRDQKERMARLHGTIERHRERNHFSERWAAVLGGDHR